MSKDDVTVRQDDLRPEYDASVLKGGVRGKYLERYRAGTNLALLAPDVEQHFRRMRRWTRRSSRS